MKGVFSVFHCCHKNFPEEHPRKEHKIEEGIS